MKTVTVAKEQLLLKLQENMKIHVEEYNEMIEVYMRMAIEKTEKLLVELNNDNKDVSLDLDLTKPRNNVKDYKDAIEVLGWEVNSNVELSEREFKQYIKDDWDFTRSFAISKAAYFARN
jgi:hypothetical protein